MPSRNHVEIRPGAVIHTGVVIINVPSICGESYFISFIDELSGHVKAFHMKLKGKAAGLLNCQVSWVDPQSLCMVKNISLEAKREYVNVSKDLEVCGIQIPSSALRKLQDDERPSG